MSSPLRMTAPESGVISPVIRLNSVVLPAPFGPMISRRSPGVTSRLTLLVTCKPPNALYSDFTPSAVGWVADAIGAAVALMGDAPRALPAAQQPAGRATPAIPASRAVRIPARVLPA